MSSGKKLRKLVKAGRMLEDQKGAFEEAVKQENTENEYEDILIHGYFLYECKDCGAVYRMWLEKGVADSVQDRVNPEDHKPVPFGIRCKCGSFNCLHSRWNWDKTLTDKDYSRLIKGESYFKNDPNVDCGVPVLRKSYRNFREYLLMKMVEEAE